MSPSRRSRRWAPAPEDSRPETRRAVDEALRLLDRRDLPRRALERRLETRGIDARDAAAAADTLGQAGLLDDGRYAAARARVLADRGWGDEGIRARLEQEGLAEPAVAEALSTLEPERDRARLIVARRGVSRRTFAHLAARGFAEDTAEAALSSRLAE